MLYTDEAEKFVKSLDERSVIEMPNNGSRYDKLLRLEESVRREHGRTLPSHIAYEHIVMGLPIHAVARGLAKYGIGSDPLLVSCVAKHFGIEINNVRKKKVEKPVDTQLMAHAMKAKLERPELYTKIDIDQDAKNLLRPYAKEPWNTPYEEIVKTMRDPNGCNYPTFSFNRAKDLMKQVRREMDFPDPDNLVEVEKERIEPDNSPRERIDFETLTDNEMAAALAKLRGNSWYSPTENEINLDLPKEIVSLDDLTTAIKYAMCTEEKDAMDSALRLLDSMGYGGWLLERNLDFQDEKKYTKKEYNDHLSLLWMLEGKNIVTPISVQEVRKNGRDWQTRFWVLNERKIREYVAKDKEEKAQAEKKKEEPKEEKPITEAKSYSELSPEEWNRDSSVPANGNGNHLK